MPIINKKELAELANVHQPFCISIFIPTHRSGQQMLERQDALMLKNELKDIKISLREKWLSINEIEQLVKPVNDLIDETEFWRYQSDGLAVFLTKDIFKKYTVPLHFKKFNYLSNEFYLKPLMPLFSGDGRFFLLTLKMDKVAVYEGTRHSIREIKITDLIPSRIEDVVGYDYEENVLQYRTQKGGQGMFHGHGGGNEEHKNELLKYFRAIDKGIMTLLHAEQSSPLIISCLDFYFPIYKEANRYPNLFPQYISGNPEDMDEFLLHEKAWNIVQPYFSKNRQEKINNFLQFQDTAKTSSDIKKILPAALNGIIDTLFLENGTDIFGTYNSTTMETNIQKSPHIPNISLMNLAAINVLLKNGNVFLMDRKEMPDSFSKINALYKY